MPNLLLTIQQQCPKVKRLAGAVQTNSFYLGALWLAYSGVAWLLRAYRAPMIVWAGTLVMTLYLAWAGINAIALTSIWVVGILSLSAIRHAWMWRIPRPYYEIEPFTLLVIWLLSLGLVVFTAMVHQQLQRQYSRIQVFYRIIVSTWLGFACGRFLYEQFTLPLLSP